MGTAPVLHYCFRRCFISPLNIFLKLGKQPLCPLNLSLCLYFTCKVQISISGKINFLLLKYCQKLIALIRVFLNRNITKFHWGFALLEQEGAVPELSLGNALTCSGVVFYKEIRNHRYFTVNFTQYIKIHKKISVKKSFISKTLLCPSWKTPVSQSLLNKATGQNTFSHWTCHKVRTTQKLS